MDFSAADFSWMNRIMEKLSPPELTMVSELLRTFERMGESEEEFPLDFDIGIGDAPVSEPLKKDNTLVGLDRRAALYTKLRAEWKRVLPLQLCLKKGQILKETAYFFYFSNLSSDPLADGDNALLSFDTALGYAHSAYDIVSRLGNLAEGAEVCFMLTHFYKTLTDFDKAFHYLNESIKISERIGNLNVLERAYRSVEEMHSLTDARPDAYLACSAKLLELYKKQGFDVGLVARYSIHAKYLTLAARFAAARENLNSAYALMEAVWDSCGERINSSLFYHQSKAFLHYELGETRDAISELEEAIRLNVTNKTVREDFLDNDLAFLETLYGLDGRDSFAFASFCRDVKVPKAINLKDWHLSEFSFRPIGFEQIEDLKNGKIPKGFSFCDHLGKSSYLFEDGFSLSPILGVTISSSVPRLSKKVRGDFVFEASMDLSKDPRIAGGILVFQNDNFFARLSVGIFFDFDVSFAVNTLEEGFKVVGRGLLQANSLELRIERVGAEFRGYCGQGEDWFFCGSAEAVMGEVLEVGLYAETTIRSYSFDRCKTVPPRFTALRLG